MLVKSTLKSFGGALKHAFQGEIGPFFFVGGNHCFRVKIAILLLGVIKKKSLPTILNILL